MRISKVTWFILIIGVAVIGAISLYLVYKGEIDEQNTLEVSVSTAQSTIPTVIAQRDSLEGQLAGLRTRLAEAQAALAVAQTLFPDDVQSIYYGDVLFFFARQFEMRVVSFAATGPTSLKVGNINYEATTFTVTIETDDIEAIMAYLTTIENDEDFETTRINSVTSQITQPDLETEEPELSTATIVITVLSYGGN